MAFVPVSKAVASFLKMSDLTEKGKVDFQDPKGQPDKELHFQEIHFTIYDLVGQFKHFLFKIEASEGKN